MSFSRISSFKFVLPWLSLGWGVLSATLISHNSFGIHKFLFFSALFLIAGLLGFVLPDGKFKAFDWLRLISQQAAIQYILFFSLPLLWKAENKTWLFLLIPTGISTLWDPLFNRLWEKSAYRFWCVNLCLILLTGLILVTWAPQGFQWSLTILILVTILVQIFLTLLDLRHESTKANEGEKLKKFLLQFVFSAWRPAALVIFFSATSSPLPAVGVWLAQGRIIVDSAEQSIACETEIAAPLGFKSEIIHLWKFIGTNLPAERVPLPYVSGNGIDKKPFRTLSRKQHFGLPFDQIVQKQLSCSVLLPGAGSVGSVTFYGPDEL